MRFADPKLLSAKAESPEGVPPSPQVRAATATRLRKCRAETMAPDPGLAVPKKEGAPGRISGYSQNSSILRLKGAAFIALTVRRIARISPRNLAGTLDFLACRSAFNCFQSTSKDKDELRWPVVAS